MNVLIRAIYWTAHHVQASRCNHGRLLDYMY